MSFHLNCSALLCALCKQRLKLNKKYGKGIHKRLHNFLETNEPISLDYNSVTNINTKRFLDKWPEIFSDPLPDNNSKIYVCNNKCKRLVTYRLTC